MNKKVIKLIAFLLIIISVGIFLQNVVYADAAVPPFMEEQTENGTILRVKPLFPKQPQKSNPVVNSRAVTIACVSTVVVLLVVYILVTSKGPVDAAPEAAAKVDNKETENKDNIEKGE